MPTQDPIGPTADEVRNAQDLQKSLSETNNTYASILSTVEKIGNAELTEQLTTAKKTAEINKIMKGYDAELKSINAIAKLSKDQLKAIKDNLSVIAKQAIESQRLNDFAKTALENERKKLGLLKDQLKTEESITREAQRQAAEERRAANEAKSQPKADAIRKVGGTLSGMDTISGSGVRSGISTGTEGVGELVGGKMGGVIGGAVGGIGTAIISMFTLFKVEASTFAKALAQSGNFVKGARDIEKFNQGMLDLRSSTRFVSGVSIADLSKKMSELASSGVNLSGTFDENVKKTIHLNAIANNLGVSLGVLGSTLLTLRRSSKGANDATEVSNALVITSNTMVKNDIMQQSEFVQMLTSVADGFSELNFSFSGTRNLLRDLTLNVKGLGVNAKVAKEITMQLTGSFKATGDEWKAFMGAKTGAGGGFLGGLFSAQQRGSGGDLLNREADPRKFMQGVMTTIKGQTSGIADPRAKMYMAETLGKNFGLDAKSTQALLKGVLGSTEDSSTAIDEMVDASAKVELSAHDQFEQWAEWFKMKVFKVLNDIYNVLEGGKKTVKGVATAGGALGGAATGAIAGAGIGSFFGGVGAIPGAVIGGAVGGVGGFFGGGALASHTTDAIIGKASGGTIPDTGMILAHRDEEVLDATTASQYRKMGGLGGMKNNGGINVSIGNISLGGGGDARSQSQAIGKAVQEESYRQIMKYHTVMNG